MYLHTQQLINEIAADEPDPAAANALQEGLGGQFPMTISPERREEFAPGLDPDLLALIQATAEVELKDADNPKEPAKKPAGGAKAPGKK